MRLLVLDIEGTLFRTEVRLPGTDLDSTIWQALAWALGPDARRLEVETHQRWARGEYKSYLSWMSDTIEIHREYGLSKDIFQKTINDARYNPEVLEAFDGIDRNQFIPVLVSGGFRELARRAQLDLQINHAFSACEYLFDSSGRLAGYNLLPCDFEGKIDFIMLMLRELGLGPDDWVFIGDGLNDVPIAKRAGTAVAYRAHPQLAEVSQFATSSFTEAISFACEIEHSTI